MWLIFAIFAGVKSNKGNTENYERHFNGWSKILRWNLTNKRWGKSMKINKLTLLIWSNSK